MNNSWLWGTDMGITPTEFISDMAEADAPSKAAHIPIMITSGNRDWEVLSYYYSEEDECMVLDIGDVDDIESLDEQ